MLLRARSSAACTAGSGFLRGGHRNPLETEQCLGLAEISCPQLAGQRATGGAASHSIAARRSYLQRGLAAFGQGRLLFGVWSPLHGSPKQPLLFSASPCLLPPLGAVQRGVASPPESQVTTLPPSDGITALLIALLSNGSDAKWSDTVNHREQLSLTWAGGVSSKLSWQQAEQDCAP